MTKSVLFSGFFLSLALSLHAIPVRFLAWDHDVANRKVLLRNGADMLEIPTLTPYKRSGQVSITKTTESVALVTPDRIGNDGQPGFVELKLPDAVDNPLVIIFSDPKSASGLRTYIINDSTKDFPWGSIRFLNATSQEFVFRHENSAVAIKGSWTPVNLVTSGESRNVEAQLYSKETPRKLYYSSIWEYDPEIRMLAIIVPGSQSATGKVDVKIIPESKRSLLVAKTP